MYTQIAINLYYDNDILTPLLSGFRHEDSTTIQLVHTYYTFFETVYKGKEVNAVFYSIS